MNDGQIHQVNVSTTTILKVVLLILGLVFLYLIKDILILLFAAIILASALDPSIDWLEKRKLPRSLSLLVLFLVVGGLVAVLIVAIVPVLADQFAAIARHFPDYYQAITSEFNRWGLVIPSLEIGQLAGQLSSIFSFNGFFTTLGSIFGGVFSFLAVLVLTFYFVVEEDSLKYFIRSITPWKHQTYVMELVNRIQLKMGLWLRGQLALSLAVFLLVLVGLEIIGMPYALLLALLAGIFEIIPYLGPILGAIPGVIIGFAISPLTGLLAAVVYFAVQEIENNFLVPKIMAKSTGLNPLVVLIAVLVGAQAGGLVGALLAVPVAVAVDLAVTDVFVRREREQAELADKS